MKYSDMKFMHYEQKPKQILTVYMSLADKLKILYNKTAIHLTLTSDKFTLYYNDKELQQQDKVYQTTMHSSSQIKCTLK